MKFLEPPIWAGRPPLEQCREQLPSTQRAQSFLCEVPTSFLRVLRGSSWFCLIQPRSTRRARRWDRVMPNWIFSIFLAVQGWVKQMKHKLQIWAECPSLEQCREQLLSTQRLFCEVQFSILRGSFWFRLNQPRSTRRARREKTSTSLIPLCALCVLGGSFFQALNSPQQTNSTQHSRYGTTKQNLRALRVLRGSTAF